MNIENQHIVRTLTCKRDLDMAIVSYKSFLRNNSESAKLIVHTDGSLSCEDIDRLYKSVQDIEIVDRRDTDELVKEVLRKYPNCLKYRDLHPLSNKILDIPILESSCVKFIDCDILFIKPFSGLFSYDKASRFSLEDDCGYSGRLIELKKTTSNTIPEGCNTGIFQMDKEKLDLDYIEWFLSNTKLCRFVSMVEQTLFAILMGTEGSVTYSDQQISTSKKHVKLTKNTVAIHFMYGLKTLFFQYANDYCDLPNNHVNVIKFSKSKNLSYSYVLRRALNRQLNKLAIGGS